MKGGRSLPWRLKAKNEREARDRYFRFLSRSLSCVSNAHWYVAPAPAKGQLVALTREVALGLLREDGSKLYLQATQNFHYAPHPDYPGEMKVATDRYAYSLSLTEGFEKELLAFHWHPGSAVTIPHVHAALADDPSFHKAHIPTGRVYFEDVLRLAIEDFGVVPLRTDWSEVLGDAADRVREFGSWR